MRKAVTLVAACAFAAGVASAQMKKPAQPAPQPSVQATGTGPIRMTGPGGTQAAPVAVPDQARRISPADALQLQKKGEAIIVDVRSNSQFSLGHIKGAVSIPASQLISRLRELTPQKLIITYCA